MLLVMQIFQQWQDEEPHKMTKFIFPKLNFSIIESSLSFRETSAKNEISKFWRFAKFH